MKKLLIITNEQGELAESLMSVSAATVVGFDEAKRLELSEFDSVAVLGGRNEVSLDSRLRVALEAFADLDRPIFLELVNSFRYVYSANAERVIHDRLVVFGDGLDGLEQGELLDPHANIYMRPHFLMPNTVPLLYLHSYVPAHDKFEGDPKSKNIALWRSDNVMWCAFSLFGYKKAGLAPKKRFETLVDNVSVFLTGKKVSKFPKDRVTHRSSPSLEMLDDCVGRSLAWLERMLKDEGKSGVFEGLSHDIYHDGTQRRANSIRTDCSGECGGAFLLSGNEKYKKYSKNLADFCFGDMMIRGGEYDGMLRWTEEAWGVCYQDDAARAMIPSLLSAKLSLGDDHVDDCVRALEFLMRTTAKDGLRVVRTDNLTYLESKKSITELKNDEKGYPCAHYNAYYSAALILCYLVTGREDMLELGEKGLESLMALYPETTREQSETSELCRLIFPLSVLYMATKKPEHREYIMRVSDDLEKMAYGGSYREWDTGYKANCSKKIDSECSLLAKNGDPIADLLYSVNWLPLGFAFAYEATGEELFREKWERCALFFIESQCLSDNELLDGAWARGFDLEKKEIYGVPHDVGWGPCSVESGWSVAEIAMGLRYFAYIDNKKV